MDSMSQNMIAEYSALGVILIGVLLFIFKGVPMILAYLKHKDDIHREDVLNLIASAREERDSFYKNLNIKLDKIHERLDSIESAVKTNILKHSTPVQQASNNN